MVTPKMAQDECCQQMITAGGMEYGHLHSSDLGSPRCFEFKALPIQTGEEGDQNERAPSLHVEVWGNFPGGYSGNAEFSICERKGGYPIKMMIYAVPRGEALEFLPKAKRVLAALWRVYCKEMLAEPCSRGDDLVECCQCPAGQCEKRDALLTGMDT